MDNEQQQQPTALTAADAQQRSPTTPTRSVSFDIAPPQVTTFAKQQPLSLPPPVQALPPPPVAAASTTPLSAWKAQLVVVLCTVLATLLVIMVAPSLRWPGADADVAAARLVRTPPVLYPMAEVVPIEPCVPLRADEVRRRVFKLSETTTVNLNDLRASMLFHMQQQNMSGMCAQFLMTQRVCYCVVNMARNDSTAALLVDMYNMIPLGYSVNTRMINTEKLPFCDKPYDVHRFNALFFEYLDSDGVVHERYASGTPAHIIQILDDVQRGEGYCIDTNLDALLVRAMRGITLVGNAMQYIEAAKTASDNSRRPLQLPRS